MNEKREKLYHISLLKTSMMVLVVLYHSMMFFSNNWFTVVTPVYKANYLYKFALILNSFHIQAFSMASGFLFFYIMSIKKEKSVKEDIFKRVKRLLFPYVFTCIFWIIPIGFVLFHYTALDVVKNFLLAIHPSQLWFLIMLFEVFVFFRLFYKKIKFNNTYLILVFIVTILLSNMLKYWGINYFQISKTIEHILYFYLGGYIYTNKDKLTRNQLIICVISVIILYFFKIVEVNINVKHIHYLVKLIDPLISGLEVIIIYYLFSYVSNSSIINQNNKVYRIIEENSFGIYLFHQQIIYFTILLFNGLVSPVFQVLLSFIISFCVSLLISAILKRNKYTKIMFGL